MNILASYNWLKEYVLTSKSPEEFARELSVKSMSVEAIRELKKEFENMVIGVVEEVRPHPNADKLRIAMTNIGSETAQIVCGGKNLETGMKVLVALPGARVKWHGEGDLVELKETKIRGEVSYGMICAAEEVGFEKAYCPPGDIWDLTRLVDAEAGTKFVDAFDMDDVLFDVEVTSNRPDAMGIIGLAREGAAAAKDEFVFRPSELPNSGTGVEISVRVHDDRCPRYMAVALQNVEVKESPLWLQRKLLLAGYRPINNVVDVTNYILHEYGQPMHAFDYATLKNGEINVRAAKSGEKFLALDEKEYELSDAHLVIADADQPVAVAGVMGGMKSGVTKQTKAIVLEAAAFDPVSVRRTARALNLYSDSQLLFEKGLSTEALPFALARAIELIEEIAGGEVASEIHDVKLSEYKPLVYSFHPEETRSIIGIDIPDKEMVSTLARLGFVLQKSSDGYDVTVPYWRDHDIEDGRDFTEEIARLYGYHNMPAVLPPMAPPIDAGDKALVWEDQIRTHFAARGYTEFYSYSFVSEEDLLRYDLNPEMAVKIHNPLSVDMSYMRTSLMPSLLRSIGQNQGHTPQGCVFELARIYKANRNDLPNEETELVVAEFGYEDAEEAFRRLKGAVDSVFREVGIRFTYERREDDPHRHPTRTATVLFNGDEVGVLGEVHGSVAAAFGVDQPVMSARLNVEVLIKHMSKGHSYKAPAAFPAVERDIAVVVDDIVSYEQLVGTVKYQSTLIESVDLKDIYRGQVIGNGKKSVTLSLTLRSQTSTLSSDEADKVMRSVENALAESFSAIIR